ncbi:GNAT family N-acetyltransferase [Deinococcus sonorensis]|uniref:GNAT family N-acetyltransferase n=1 Tax=Deinococcus sonorensis KR-87 TaxID=694439 RepID=A0AAU7UB15_9DEIO
MITSRLRHVTDPQDPAIQAFGQLQNRVYFEPDMLIPAQYIAQMLAQPSGTRRDGLVVAENDSGELLGGTLFHYLPDADSGFGSFSGIRPDARGQGLLRRLDAERWRVLDELAGHPCPAVFIDVANPQRETPKQQEQERRAGSDALERRRKFHALGFRTVDVVYWQPVGGENGGPVKDMDLLVNLREPAPQIETSKVVATMRAYWTPWMGPERAARYARELEERAGGRTELPLLDAWEGPQGAS